MLSRADQSFVVDPNANWSGFINPFELDGVTGTGANFSYPSNALRLNFAGGPALPLTLASNTLLWDEASGDAFWWIGGVAQKAIESNGYQENDGVVGENITFDWQTVANDLP